MISKKTVFITGAGASSDYYYPCGSEFLKQIIDKLLLLDNDLSKINHIDFDWRKGIGKEIAQLLYDSKPLSIDEWLSVEVNKKYRSCIQFIISHLILSYEAKFADATNTYFDSIWNMMIKDARTIDQFLTNKVSFITFNYDRTIEVFLKTRIKSRYGIQTEAEMEIILDHFKVFHFYNTCFDSTFEIEYGKFAPLDPYHLNCLIKKYQRVSLIYDQNDDHYIENVSNQLYIADRIVFLGFAFHEKATDIILQTRFKDDVKVYASLRLESNYAVDDLINKFSDRNISLIHDRNMLDILMRYKRDLNLSE